MGIVASYVVLENCLKIKMSQETQLYGNIVVQKYHFLMCISSGFPYLGQSIQEWTK